MTTRLTHHPLGRIASVVAVVALLGSSGAINVPVAAAGAANAAAKRRAVDDRTIAHVLNRIAFGAAPGDVARVRAMGLDAYIAQQLQPERLADSAMAARLARFETLTLPSRDIAERFYEPLEELRRTMRQKEVQDAKVAPEGGAPDAEAAGSMPAPAQGALNGDEVAARLANLSPEERQNLRKLREQSQQVLGELSEQKLLRAVYSERQLEEVLVDFWFNHFNVFAGKGPTRVYLTEYERDAIRPHVLGRFRDLLGATAHSPAMLFYLDNWQSSDPEASAQMQQAVQRRTARGGRNRGLAGDMTDEQRAARLQALQNRMPKGLNENYGRELLELHTLGVDGGYTQKDIVAVAQCFTGWTIQEPRRGGGFRFDERRHVKGPKTVLGKTIDKGGVEDGEAVLDLLALHPSTARFIATKLGRRFVADAPPKALVDRAAAKFTSTHGDLREVLRTILTSPEFVSAEAMRAKVKTPLEFVASALRATGAQIEDGTALVRNLQSMGMPLYMAQPPTGYIDRADVWVNTGSLVNRMNFAVALVNNRLRGVRIELGQLTKTDAAAPSDLDAARDALLASLLSNDVSDTTRATIAKSSAVAQVAALTLGSPEFQRR